MNNDSTLCQIPIKKIFSLDIAKQLQMKGFQIIGTEPNLKFPQYKVFLFKATPQMLKTCEMLQAEKKKYIISKNSQNINKEYIKKALQNLSATSFKLYMHLYISLNNELNSINFEEISNTYKMTKEQVYIAWQELQEKEYITYTNHLFYFTPISS